MSTGAGGCAVSTPNVPDGPDPAGGCFPGPSNTGVPAGTTLSDYTGPCTITTADTVIDSKTVTCKILVRAKLMEEARAAYCEPKASANVVQIRKQKPL